MIRLTYKSNGARFRREYLRSDWRSAITRARDLRGNGIAVRLEVGPR
jgi:hypothetical protein